MQNKFFTSWVTNNQFDQKKLVRCIWIATNIVPLTQDINLQRIEKLHYSVFQGWAQFKSWFDLTAFSGRRVLLSRALSESQITVIWFEWFGASRVKRNDFGRSLALPLALKTITIKSFRVSEVDFKSTSETSQRSLCHLPFFNYR